MHDPLVVAFEIRRPWPKRSRARYIDGTPAPTFRYWPSIITVWHREPGGHDALTICRKRTQQPDGTWKYSRTWIFHVHHWKLQIHPLQHLRRRMLTRCTWCGGRSRKTDPVNVSHQWDGPRGRWWRGEPGLFHEDCSAIKSAHGTCLCDDPLTQESDYGPCARCGKYRTFGLTEEALARMRPLAEIPAGGRGGGS
jgi:hypothetical protein